jgi:hypothetical protein
MKAPELERELAKVVREKEIDLSSSLRDNIGGI